MHWGWRNEYRSDASCYEYYWMSSENKAGKKFRPVQDLNPWVTVKSLEAWQSAAGVLLAEAHSPHKHHFNW